MTDGDHLHYYDPAYLFLVVSTTGILRPVTDGEFAMPGDVEWHEDEGFVRIGHGVSRPHSRVPLKWAEEP